MHVLIAPILRLSSSHRVSHQSKGLPRHGWLPISRLSSDLQKFFFFDGGTHTDFAAAEGGTEVPQRGVRCRVDRWGKSARRDVHEYVRTGAVGVGTGRLCPELDSGHRELLPGAPERDRQASLPPQEFSP